MKAVPASHSATMNYREDTVVSRPVQPRIPDMGGEEAVIVVFPMKTWQNVEDMARRSGMNTTEVLTAALQIADLELKKAGK